MRYCALLNNTYNVGDDIQTVAQMRFLPQVDCYAFKERLRQGVVEKRESNEKAKVILNAWYMWNPKGFPPSDELDPLPIAMHFSEACRKKLLTAETKNWMLQHGPIGCRDHDSKEWLEKNGIPAYFSGCLTLTLTENPKLRQNSSFGGYILCVDVSPQVVETVRKRTKRPVYVISKNTVGSFTAKDRLQVAKIYLYLYHQAAAVVTGNMHSSLPSLAFNTPVCLLRNENKGPDVEKRFRGLGEFFNAYTTEEFMRSDVFNFDDPPQNPNKHLEVRAQLVERCKAFTGFDSETPTLPDTFDPSMELLHLVQMMTFTNQKVYKEIIAANGRLVLKALLNRLRGKTKHDLIDY